MAFIRTRRVPEGGGGGGLVINGWATEDFLQETNFVSGAVTLTLAHTPVASLCVQLLWNGQGIYEGLTWSISGNIITIEFSDPYVEDSEDPLYFQAQYPY